MSRRSFMIFRWRRFRVFRRRIKSVSILTILNGFDEAIQDKFS